MYANAENGCQSGRFRFRILAPSRIETPKTLTHDVSSSDQHSKLMFDLQKLRGSVYREYAGIAATLLPDGRHWHKLDAESWHILLEDAEHGVVGCARYRPIFAFDDLICSKAAVALSPETGPIFRTTFEKQVTGARRLGMHYGEASAWALSEKARCSTAAVNIALMGFALAEWLGAGICITTASTRHHASLILRRLGGKPFAGFEPYYEPMFDCFIELLQFDTASLQPRYQVKLEEMKAELRRTQILCPIESGESIKMPAGISAPTYFPAATQRYSASLQ